MLAGSDGVDDRGRRFHNRTAYRQRLYDLRHHTGKEPHVASHGDRSALQIRAQDQSLAAAFPRHSTIGSLEAAALGYMLRLHVELTAQVGKPVTASGLTSMRVIHLSRPCS